jgi:hypothetical protein
MITEESKPTVRTNGFDAPIPAPASPAPADSGYTLTDGERMGFHAMNQQILNAKLVVYNLNAALEQALKEVARVDAQFSGVLGFLGNAHGMSQVQISPDFSRIAPPKEGS